MALKDLMTRFSKSQPQEPTPVVKDIPQVEKEPEPKAVLNTPTTLTRLEKLETALDSFSKLLNGFKLQKSEDEDYKTSFQKRMTEIEKDQKIRKANVGFNTDLQEYTPFNEIRVNESLNSRLVFDSNMNAYVEPTRLTVDHSKAADYATTAGSVKQADTALKANDATNCTFAKESEVSNMAKGLESNVLVEKSAKTIRIKYKEGFEPIENILEEYISKSELSKILDEVGTFSEFKQELKKRL